MKKNIVLVALYHKSTHLLQPIDVAVFHSLKLSWKNLVNDWKTKNLTETVKKYQFAGIFNSVIKRKDHRQNHTEWLPEMWTISMRPYSSRTNVQTK